MPFSEVPTLTDDADYHEYTEQSAAKLQMGLLERLDPMSRDFEDKLGHLEGAVKHHVYQEEGTWIPELIEESGAADHRMIEQRYSEEFDRYVSGGTSAAIPPTGDRPAEPNRFEDNRALTLLGDEFERTMALAGVNDVASLARRHVRNPGAGCRAAIPIRSSGTVCERDGAA